MTSNNQPLTQTELWIIDALNKFAIDYFKQSNRSSTFVTQSIKEIIGDHGSKKRFQVCASGFPNFFHNEWLYDIVWYKEDKNKNLTEVELVLESEMLYGLAAIKFDFEKLLVANANHRVMICLAGRTPIKEIQEYFSTAVARFKGLKKGERVLTLIWDDFETGSFYSDLWIK